eukprot:gb/GECG01016061.1/.p1 GENE.gb/GECG01016061.1/~~gb/GECG01016061.1/.p1  ORF type:complete len:284 (+),score=30.18 gb/GECG01016061.1/:1-852(+)
MPESEDPKENNPQSGHNQDVSDTDRGHAYVHVLADVLNRIVDENDKKGSDSSPVTKFHALRAPAISILDYLERILRYASCSSECFILALIYIDRLIQRNQLVLSSLNVHRIIITSVMLAAKFFDDQYFNNAYYAKVGGVPCDEMNALEMEFLFSINFSLHVNTDTYCRYFAELSSHMQPSVEMQPIPPTPETLQTLKTEQGIPVGGHKDKATGANAGASAAASSSTQDVRSQSSKSDKKSEDSSMQKSGSSQTHHSYVQSNGRYGDNGGISNDRAVVETAVAS